jgi:hypothetical protein
MLVGMIHRGERGVPPTPYRLLIEGKWRDGNSAPAANAKKQQLARAGKTALART